MTYSHSNRTARRREDGQAIIEFLVAALAMVPLFILIPLIGKYLDMKHSSIAASRALAFECTVRYEDCADLNRHPSFADEIRMRFFAGNAQSVLSNDRPERDEVAMGNPLWVDRRGRPLLERYSDVGVRADARTLSTPGALRTASNFFGPGRMGLEMERGLFDARVQVNVAARDGGADFLSQLDSLALNMQFHTAVLTDAWSARDPGRRGDRCNPERRTVAGRASEASLCMIEVRGLDQTIYLPGATLVEPLSRVLLESNAGDFDFHDFMDGRFSDRVPTSDPVGFPRLQ